MFQTVTEMLESGHPHNEDGRIEPRCPGWQLYDNDEHGLHIEKCDLCGIFSSDEEAVMRVVRIAMMVENAAVKEAT
jgi:hypothetical protein